MAQLKSGTTIAGSTAWHAGNDGAGSGLDADTLDGVQASEFTQSTDYATSTTGGTVKARVSGDTLYLTTNGNNA